MAIKSNKGLPSHLEFIYDIIINVFTLTFSASLFRADGKAPFNTFSVKAFVCIFWIRFLFFDRR